MNQRLQIWSWLWGMILEKLNLIWRLRIYILEQVWQRRHLNLKHWEKIMKNFISKILLWNIFSSIVCSKLFLLRFLFDKLFACKWSWWLRSWILSTPTNMKTPKYTLDNWRKRLNILNPSLNLLNLKLVMMIIQK